MSEQYEIYQLTDFEALKLWIIRLYTKLKKSCEMSRQGGRVNIPSMKNRKLWDKFDMKNLEPILF